eukprot:773329-Amphidinium_carterae.1
MKLRTMSVAISEQMRQTLARLRKGHTNRHLLSAIPSMHHSLPESQVASNASFCNHTSSFLPTPDQKQLARRWSAGHLLWQVLLLDRTAIGPMHVTRATAPTPQDLS